MADGGFVWIMIGFAFGEKVFVLPIHMAVRHRRGLTEEVSKPPSAFSIYRFYDVDFSADSGFEQDDLYSCTKPESA